jgi:TIR domain-containing protein
MKVFISWSGERSKQLAEAIREWLPNVLQFVKPYFTPADIEKGARWASEISKELEQSKIGIIAMTEENLTSPWIMFEAGAISRVVEEGRVCPIVFGVRKTDLVGPLASFQAIEFNRAEVRQLLTTINNAAKEAALLDRGLDAAFDKWWPDLEKKVKAVPTALPLSGPHRSERDLLEEIVENTRNLIRELQPLLPWQRFAQINPENVATVAALLRRGSNATPQEGILYEANKPTTGGGILGGTTTSKSE